MKIACDCVRFQSHHHFAGKIKQSGKKKKKFTEKIISPQKNAAAHICGLLSSLLTSVGVIFTQFFKQMS